LKAVKNVNEIIGPAIIGRDPSDQRGIDDLMVQQLDGSKNEWGWSKAKLGANAILGVSMAICRAAAAAQNIPLYQHIANLAGNRELTLPVPAFNIINGGTHAGNKLAFQEFMVLPVEARSFSEAMKMGTEVYHNLKKVISNQYGIDATNVGDEGGFAPNISSAREGLELIKKAIANAGYTGKVKIGMDCAASEFHRKEDGKYDLNFKIKDNTGKDAITADALLKEYRSYVKDFPVISIEDPFEQDDWDAWVKITGELGKDVQIMATTCL